jgi:hypothetical protein
MPGKRRISSWCKWATVLIVRAERRACELLQKMETHQGNQGAGRGKVRPSSPNESLKLKELGIFHDLSSRWQKAAQLPEPEFEAWLKKAAETLSGKVTTQAILAPPVRGTAGSGLPTYSYIFDLFRMEKSRSTIPSILSDSV